MKRGRSKIEALLKEEQPGVDGCHDDLEVPPLRLQPRSTGLATPPSSPEHEARPSKLRRHGSKILTVLRSMTNSASHASVAETDVSIVTASKEPRLGKKISMAILKSQLDSTLVRRAELKSPRPIIISMEEASDAVVVEITPESSPPSSAIESLSTSRKSSAPGPGQSTRKTSLDSKWSSKYKGAGVSASGTSSENKKSFSKQTTGEAGSNESALASIAETEGSVVPMPAPTIVTVEKASAAKVFFECHYNDVTSPAMTNRTLRRRQLEAALHDDRALSEVEKNHKRLALAQMETDHLREMRVMKARGMKALTGKDVINSRYDVVKVLGKGSFGVVRLVREKVDRDPAQLSHGYQPMKQGAIYAMKVIRKSDMLRNSQEGHLRAERDFLVSAEGSRWVVPLIASFQDLTSLYLVMDYMPGGDFLGLLIRDNILSEPVTKWYIAEMILCIEEAHALRWIHRDIKPDNFLISASGHLKISDFGLAFDGHWSHDQSYFNNQRYSLLKKLGINVEGDTLDRKEARSLAANLKMAQVVTNNNDCHERNSSETSDSGGILNWRNRNGNRTFARSVVGTSQYMAPEVVRGELYDARCDWWSVAVILYECLYGHTPFLAEEGGRQQTKLNILAHRKTFAFPSKPVVSRRCQDLIRSIIQDKDQRVCSKRYKLNDDLLSGNNRDYAGRYVYPHDAEDIKCHKWFRDIQWDKLHFMVPPFVPNIKSLDDTHYFDEEEPISDFSESVTAPQATQEEINEVLRRFNREIQIIARGFIDKPHDSARLKRIDREIDSFIMAEEQKEYLKAFIKHYGRKEKKRPRDRLLRDRETAPRVLEMRKQGAFLGYTYRRFRGAGRQSIGRAGGIAAVSPIGKKVWYRARLSIH